MLEIPFPPSPPPKIERSFIPGLASRWEGRSAATDPLGKEEGGKIKGVLSADFQEPRAADPFSLL